MGLNGFETTSVTPAPAGFGPDVVLTAAGDQDDRQVRVMPAFS